MFSERTGSTLDPSADSDRARLESENFGFQEFEEVKVRRSGGVIERGWKIMRFEADEKTGEKKAIVMSPSGQHKGVLLPELYETQKEEGIEPERKM